MTLPSEDDARQALRHWVRDHSPVPPGEDFDDATPLIASGHLTSLQVTDLLLFVEEMRDEPLDPDSLRPGVFRDIDTIYATFLAVPSAADTVTPTPPEPGDPSGTRAPLSTPGSPPIP